MSAGRPAGLPRVVAILACLAGAARATAAEIATFVFDPAASTFSAGGTIDGRTLGDQTAGSASTPVTGSFEAEIDRGAGTITFYAGPRLSEQPVPQRPAPEPYPSLLGLAAGAPGDPLFANIYSLRPQVSYVGAPFSGPLVGRPGETGFAIADRAMLYATGDGPGRNVDLHGYGAPGGQLRPRDPHSLREYRDALVRRPHHVPDHQRAGRRHALPGGVIRCHARRPRPDGLALLLESHALLPRARHRRRPAAA